MLGKGGSTIFIPKSEYKAQRFTGANHRIKAIFLGVCDLGWEELGDQLRELGGMIPSHRTLKRQPQPREYWCPLPEAARRHRRSGRRSRSLL